MEILNEKAEKKCLFINMDQTPIFYDMSRKFTYNEKNKKQITVKKTIGDKMRATVCLTVASDGTKFPPYLIFKSDAKKPLRNDFEDHSIIRTNKRGF